MKKAATSRFDPFAFARDEEGAVTVDWVVLAAAAAILSVPLLLSIRTATEASVVTISADIQSATE